MRTRQKQRIATKTWNTGAKENQQLNPGGPSNRQKSSGPRHASIFPCGYCERPVNWSDQEGCCDECGIWHHKSCGDISSKEMEYLERSSVVWLCCKCDSVNVDTFTFIFNRYELYTSNMYQPLSGNELTIGSF